MLATATAYHQDPHTYPLESTPVLADITVVMTKTMNASECKAKFLDVLNNVTSRRGRIAFDLLSPARGEVGRGGYARRFPLS